MEWQLINTAPKDGTRILGYDTKNSEWYAMFWVPPDYFSRTGDWAIDGIHGYESETIMFPTHWIPLPTPPNA